MNKLHKSLLNKWSLGEIQQEDRLQDVFNAPSEPELAADWALRKELTELAPEPLSSELRRRVLVQTRRFPSRWAGGIAVAASISGLLLASQWLHHDEQRITPKDAQNFQFAMQTISAASQQAARMTGYELEEHVRMPAVELERLPFGNILQAVITNTTEPEINQESET